MQKHSSWAGFLPSRALVMGTRGARPALALQKSGETPRVLTHAETQLVRAEGNPSAELVFVAISQALPSAHGGLKEDPSSTRPFAGRSGELLSKMIEALGLNPLEVYLCEVFGENPSLEGPLGALSPKVIVALGDSAAQTLTLSQLPLTELRGKFRGWRGIQIMPTFHPEHLLSHPGAKREAWSDLQAVARELGLTLPAKK